MRGLIRLGKNWVAVLVITAIFSFSSQTAFASSITTEKIIELTNQKRIEYGVPPLSVSSQLTQAANKKAEDMVMRNYWSHTTPEGKPFWTFVDEYNYNWSYLGENLAADFDMAESAVDAWFNSPTHRKNILNPEYQDIGVGVYGDIVVALYGQKSKAINPLSIIPKLFHSFYSLLFGS